MKTKLKLIGFIALVAVIGLSMAACDNGGGGNPTSGVTTVAVTGVTLSQTAISLAVGNSQTLTATVTPDNATNKAVT